MNTEHYLFEEWKDFSWNNVYQISNFGRVRSTNYGRLTILKQSKGTSGYPCVSLSKGGKVKTFAVHRMVAEAFIPNPNNLPCVNHKDEDRTNNVVSNLEWCDYVYNNNYGTGIARRREKESKRVMQYTLEGKPVRTWNCIRDIQRELGYDNSSISAVCRGYRGAKSAYGYIWRYE